MSPSVLARWLARDGQFARDQRAVSVTVGYVLTLVVAALLLGTLITAAGGLMSSQSQSVVAGELEVVGNQLAANIGEANHLAQVAHADANASNTSTTVALDVTLPRQVAGTGYLVDIEADRIVLEASNPTVVVEVPYRATVVTVETDGRFSGGPIQLNFEADPNEPISAGQLEVHT